MSVKFSPLEYDPLPSPTCVRLLTVRHPLAKASPAICGVTLLSCKLVTVDLEDKPHFNALSYTWGNPNPLDRREQEGEDSFAPHNQWPISVNGKLFFITKNLYDGLSQLKVDEWSDDTEVDARYQPYNKTRLIQAAEEGRFDDVEDSLRHGANIHNVDCFGETALHYAAENGHAEIVELLLAQGADRNIIDDTDRTPLDCCLQRKRRRYRDIAEMLESGAEAFSAATAPGVQHQRSQQIWIDAICVNQDDVAERNAQVAMMTRIYGQAQSVIIWLGAFDQHSTDDIYHQMPTILSSSSECFKKSWEAWHRRKKTGQSDEDDDEVQNGTILSSEKIGLLLQFVRRAYFHRIWVLQEVALARNVRIMFGGDDLPWSALFQVFQAAIDFEFVGLNYNTKLVKYHYGDMGTLAWSLADVRLHSRRTKLEDSIVTAQLKTLRDTNPEFVALEENWWHSKLPLSTLIALTWNFAATDPRDKIFALLGIARPEPGEAPFVADYTKSITEVFTEVGKTYIQAKGDNRYQDWRSGEIEDFEPLEALSFVQNLGAVHEGWCWLRPFAQTQNLLPRPDDLPSWVPSFHWPLTTRRLFNSRFSASGSTTARIYPFESDVLRLDGLMIDTITNLEEQRHDDSCCYCGTANVLGWLKAMAAIDPIYPTGCDRVEALWQVLTANCYLKRAFPLTVYSWAEDPVGEDFADYILETLPKELMDRGLCDDSGIVEAETASWLRDVFAKDNSRSFPDIEDVLASVKTAKEGEDKEGDGDESHNGDEEEEQEQQEAGGSDEEDSSGHESHEGDSESYEEIQHEDAVDEAHNGNESRDTPAGSENDNEKDDGRADEAQLDGKKKEDDNNFDGNDSGDDEDGDAHANSFEYFMWCVWPLRRVASTSRGYLGLVPRTSQAGDQVWLFAGGRTPYVLRPTDLPGQFTFIGEAYVHGVMDGEAAEGKQDNFKPVQLR